MKHTFALLALAAVCCCSAACATADDAPAATDNGKQAPLNPIIWADVPDVSVLRVDGEAVFGESYEVLKEYYVVHASYTKDNAQELYLHLSPVMEFENSNEAPVRAPSEQLNVSGVTVSLNLDHYKVVPEDYQKTEDDLAREAAGHYYVSFGSEKIEEYDMAFASFSLGDVNYTLMDMKADEDSFTTLAQMAKEIIEESKA